MSRLFIFVLCFSVAASVSVRAQEVEGGEGQQQTNILYWSNDVDLTAPSAYAFSPYVFFDVELLNGDQLLDIASGGAISTSGTYNGLWQGEENYNVPNGEAFPIGREFFLAPFNYPITGTNWTINDVVFGKLRPAETRKDLTLCRQNQTEIYFNNGTGLPGVPNLILSGSGTRTCAWGYFRTGSAVSPDLLTFTDTGIRFYQNHEDNTVGQYSGVGLTYDPTSTFSIAVWNPQLLQMTQKKDDHNSDKEDLVGLSNSNTIAVWKNNGSNGFSAPVLYSFAPLISYAIGDIDGDEYNDMVVFDGLHLLIYLNAADGSGALRQTEPVQLFTSQDVFARVVISDVAFYQNQNGNESIDPLRKDGWGDIVVIYQTGVRVYVNRQNLIGYLYASSADQQLTYSLSGTFSKVVTADMQNTGSSSIVLSTSNTINRTRRISVLRHVGNPAPVPPKSIAVSFSSCPVKHPVITWASNTERDIAGYNVYKRNDATGLWVKQNASLITGNSWTDYNEQVLCEVHSGYPVWRHYYVTAVDNAAPGNESSQSSQVNALVDGQASSEKRTAGGTDKPTLYALQTAYPNPFNPSTQIKFDLPEDGFVTLNVFDVLGRKVAEIANGNYAAGYHSTTWNASDVASGVYFARFTATDASGKVKLNKVSKLLLAK